MHFRYDYCLFVGFIIIIAGCSANTDQDGPLGAVSFSLDTLTTYQINGNVFNSSDSLGFPFSLAVGDDQLFVEDASSVTSRNLLIFDRTTGDFLLSAVNQGEGPLEMNGLRSLDFKPNQDSGWIYDSSQRKIQFFEKNSLTNRMIRLEEAGFIFGAVMIEGGSIAAVGMHESGRLAIYSPSGEFVKFQGPDPPGDPEIPNPVRNHAYQSWLATNSSGNRIVSATWYSDQIEIFGSQGLLHLVRGPGFHEPKYSVHGDNEGNSWPRLENDTIIGYLSVDATDKYIFALYCGKTMGWSRNTGTGTAWGYQIIVFDWNGTPRALIQIEDGALQIGVSGDGQDLYAIYHRPTPLILHYELPDLG